MKQNSVLDLNRNCGLAVHPDERYCMHGTYVGGCGIDYMCGACEDGITLYEWALGLVRRQKEYDNRQRKNLAFRRMLALWESLSDEEMQRRRHLLRVLTGWDRTSSF